MTLILPSNQCTSFGFGSSRSGSGRWVGPSFFCTAGASAGGEVIGSRIPAHPPFPATFRGEGLILGPLALAGAPLPELLGVPCTGRFVAPLTSSGDPWVVESPRPQPWTKCATSVWHRVPDRTHLPGLLHSAEALTTENPTLTPAAPGQRSRGKSFKIKTLTRPFC